MHRVFFDGGRGDRHISYGYVVYDPNGQIISKGGNRIEFHLTRLDSNHAELLALIFVMIETIRLGIKDVTFYGDSAYVINGVNGLGKAKTVNGKLGHILIRELIGSFDTIGFEWVPRENNKVAHREGK